MCVDIADRVGGYVRRTEAEKRVPMFPRDVISLGEFADSFSFLRAPLLWYATRVCETRQGLCRFLLRN